MDLKEISLQIGEKLKTIDDVILSNDPNFLREIVEEKGWGSPLISMVLRNTSCPSDVLDAALRAIDEFRKTDMWGVTREAARNPNCSPEALGEVVDYLRNKSFMDNYELRVFENIISNSSCPSRILSEILEEKKENYISYMVIGNPNVSPKSKLDWYEATGQLTKYDPEKFELEHVEEDKDLEELRKLMGNNNNWYKMAQEEDWYNKETAKNTKDPEILTKILRKEKDDWTSWHAASNPNSPSEVLDEILRKGNDDAVSIRAAYNSNCPSESLAEVLRRGNNDRVSRYAARNPNCPPKAKIEWLEATGQLTKYDPEKFELEKFPEDKDLEELRKLMGNNNNWYKVAQEEDWYSVETAKNSKDPEMLAKILIKGKSDEVSWRAAQNPNCPPEVLYEIIKRKQNDYVSQDAASNPNCPHEALVEVLKRGKNDEVSWRAASNPNCPPEALADVLRRKQNDVISRRVVRNPNCHPKAKIEWYEATNQLTKYDPKIHELEHVEGDKDLEELRKLMGKNNNWYKVTQEEDWYNVETAKNTNDPEMLAKILRKGKNDEISWRAAGNPNCPPEVLYEIVKRKQNDYVSQDAVKNPNCPPDALAEVLRRGKNDRVSYLAARNPNCPSEVLAEVLRRGENNITSWSAAENPNCPPEALAEVLRRKQNDVISRRVVRNPNCHPKAKIEWYEATNQLTKYDPEIHELEHVEEDKDLEELKKLMGKNRNWYKMAQEEDWYNLFTAKHTSDSETLSKILRKGKDDLISYYAAESKSCPPEALTEVLRRGKDDFVSRIAAENKNCPPETLAEVLKRGNDDNVSWNASLNPSAPPEALAEVLMRGKNDSVSWNAAEHINAPSDALAEVLKRGEKNSVSARAFQNPNCSPKARLDWLEKTGQLTKYDPEKHELEKVPEDNDLEELRKLMGKNRNWYKIAQEEDWYNVETAKNTKDPNILESILRKGKNDLISIYAVENPNCPPEVLAEVFKRGEDDWISWCVARNPNCPSEILGEVLRRGKNNEVSCYAARNPNCPPEALAEVLRRGKNDKISWEAAQNPNCPPEALAEVLKRGKDDEVSQNAASNPNCPPKERIDWLEKTGKLTKYDPGKFELEHSEEDKDLEELRKLLSYNTKINKYAQIWNVDIYSDNFEDKIEALYELEYKYSMVRDRFEGVEERKQNILKNLESRLQQVLKDVKTELVNVFEKWLASHALLEPQKWTEARLKDYFFDYFDSDDLENMDFHQAYQQMIADYDINLKRGRNQSAFNVPEYGKTFREMMEYAFNNLDEFPNFKKLMEQLLDEYKQTEINDTEILTLKELKEQYDKNFRNKMQAVNYINKKTLDDVDMESILYVEDDEQFVKIFDSPYVGKEIGLEILKEMIEKIVFPAWYGYWTAEGIDETRENVEKVYNNLKKISFSNTKDSLAAISIALNAVHQTGDMTDYIDDIHDVQELKTFLDEMSSGTKTEEWNNELREIGVVI